MPGSPHMHPCPLQPSSPGNPANSAAVGTSVKNFWYSTTVAHHALRRLINEQRLQLQVLAPATSPCSRRARHRKWSTHILLAFPLLHHACPRAHPPPWPLLRSRHAQPVPKDRHASYGAAFLVLLTLAIASSPIRRGNPPHLSRLPNPTEKSNKNRTSCCCVRGGNASTDRLILRRTSLVSAIYRCQPLTAINQTTSQRRSCLL
ncbi:hypothetical protein K461DRAFT_128196 [Myriangium duriaei CBS 260.36]|uniref:Uncharacterized protein n=1 Tax=Myriangium duriaei CBS 260.36 TaxID=1168546 RepID=A0A9P4J8G0_9PEZI|nr:hypothetical protein K461DRAFT_128196 [Myriangium duriaei CBS 260.36]